jgi:hypothetical protein
LFVLQKLKLTLGPRKANANSNLRAPSQEQFAGAPEIAILDRQKSRLFTPFFTAILFACFFRSGYGPSTIDVNKREPMGLPPTHPLSREGTPSWSTTNQRNQSNLGDLSRLGPKELVRT